MEAVTNIFFNRTVVEIKCLDKDKSPISSGLRNSAVVCPDKEGATMECLGQRWSRILTRR